VSVAGRRAQRYGVVSAGAAPRVVHIIDSREVQPVALCGRQLTSVLPVDPENEQEPHAQAYARACALCRRTYEQQNGPGGAALEISEDAFQSRVVDYARLRGWLVVHYRPAPAGRSGRYATPLQGNKGCPDLILARTGRVLLVELKSQRGRLSVDQAAWLGALGRNGRLWRPRDWPAIQNELR
jgi:hypothetical protein